MSGIWSDKAKKAIAILEAAGISTSSYSPYLDLHRLYRKTQNLGYKWDEGEWKYYPPPTSLPPSEIIAIRIRADGQKISSEIAKIKAALEEKGYTIIKEIGPYPRRFPKEADSSFFIEIKGV
ncbi:MAG: hypothetical protein ACRCT1_20180 [Microcoleaceae cyanobacterium]